MTLAASSFVLAAGPHSDRAVSEGKKQCEAGNFQQAIKSLTEAVEIQPNDPLLWSCLGQANAALGRTAGAIDAYKKALSLNSKTAPVWFRLAAVYSSENKTRQAIVCYRKGLAVDSANPAANKSYALLLLKAGNFVAAIPSLRTAIKAEPESKSLRLALIEVFLRTNRSGDAETEIERLLKSASNDDQLELTRILIGAKQLDRAQSILEGLTKSSPALAEAHAQFGLLLMEKERLEDAAWELGRAAQLAPESSRYSIGLSEVLLRWHHYSTALEFLNGIKPRFEMLPEFQYNLAYSYYGMRNFESAISTATALLQQHPRFAAAQFLLGNCYVARGDFSTAESHFLSAIQQDSTKPAYYAALAQVSRYQGQMTKASEFVRKGLALGPKDTDLIFESALCQEKEGNLASAQAMLEKLVTQESGLIKAHRALARVYGRLGKAPEAEKEEQKLAELEARERIKTPGPEDDHKR